MFFLHDVAEGAESGPANAGIEPPADDGVLDEDYFEFASAASSELADEEHLEPSSPRPRDDLPSEVVLAPPAFGLPPVDDSAELPPPPDLPEIELGPPPRGKSIAHWDFENNNIAFLSLDLETGGEYCGIIQLSGQIFCPDADDPGGFGIVYARETFNEYIKPPEGAIWNEEACRASHGLTARSPQIQNALPFVSVWTKFCAWVNDHLLEDHHCILCAYRGETCDLRWIWKHCLAPRSQLTIPHQIKYFMDPLEVIKNYRSCSLHPSKSKLDSLELGVVYKYITGDNLNGAHDSLVDVKAQTIVITSCRFMPHIDKTKSIRLIDEMFSKAETRDMLKGMESLRPVHEPWVELVEGDDFEYTPHREDRYTGPEGGAEWGPSSEMLQLARAGNLADMFLNIFTRDTLKFVANRTKDYANVKRHLVNHAT